MDNYDARLAVLEAKVDNMTELTQTVRDLALSLREMTTKVDLLSHDVTEIKTKPQKRWDAAIASLISAIIGALVTYFLKK